MTPGGALTTGPIVNPHIGYDPGQGVRVSLRADRNAADRFGRPDLPVKSLSEAVAYAKANPGKLRWGSQGFGTAPHLLAEMFRLEAGINIAARALSRHRPAAQRHSGRRGANHCRSQHDQPAIHPGRQASSDRNRRQ